MGWLNSFVHVVRLNRQGYANSILDEEESKKKIMSDVTMRRYYYYY